VVLGTQSLVDARLQFLKRGHTSQQTTDAIKRLYELSGVDLGVHLMLGLRIAFYDATIIDEERVTFFTSRRYLT
jgi:histone acetyltransferase (RNA polymerase elongator complex component)